MTSLSPAFLYMFLALAVVLVLAWVVIRFLSGIYTQRVLKGDIQVRSTFSLGSRQQLFVVKFRDKDYFLGVTQNTIQLLDSMPTQPDADLGKPDQNYQSPTTM